MGCNFSFLVHQGQQQCCIKFWWHNCLASAQLQRKVQKYRWKGFWCKKIEGFFCLLPAKGREDMCGKKNNNHHNNKTLEIIMIYKGRGHSSFKTFSPKWWFSFFKNTGYFSDQKPCTMPVSLLQGLSSYQSYVLPKPSLYSKHYLSVQAVYQLAYLTYVMLYDCLLKSCMKNIYGFSPLPQNKEHLK